MRTDRIVLGVCLAAFWVAITCPSQTLQPIPNAPAENVDVEYIRLLHWSDALEEVLKGWNQVCAGKTLPECQLLHQRLETEMANYIISAVRYKSRGENCASEIRQRVIQYTIAVYSWNLNCAGKPSEICVNTEADNADEKKCLGAAMEECSKLQDENL